MKEIFSSISFSLLDRFRARHLSIFVASRVAQTDEVAGVTLTNLGYYTFIRLLHKRTQNNAASSFSKIVDPSFGRSLILHCPRRGSFRPRFSLLFRRPFD